MGTLVFKPVALGVFVWRVCCLQVQALLSTLNMQVDRNTLLVHEVTIYYSTGASSAFMPVDERHPLMNTPRLASLIPVRLGTWWRCVR